MGPEGVEIVPSSIRSAIAVLATGLVFTACAETEFVIHAAKQYKEEQKAKAPATGRYKVGDPYKIDGVYYYPAVDFDYSETGVASWYGPKFDGRATANGETFDMNELSAAHRTLPMPSMVRVVNLDNGRSLALRVNDRGPFARGRIIDVSRRAAQLLGFRYRGTARVKVELMADESRRLAALSQSGETPEDKRVALAPVPAPNKIVIAVLSPPTGPPPPAPTVNSSPSAAPVVKPDKAALSLIDLALDLEPVRPTALYVQAGHGIHNARDRCMYQVKTRRAVPRIMRIAKQNASSRIRYVCAEHNRIAPEAGFQAKPAVAGGNLLAGRFRSCHIIFEAAEAVTNANSGHQSGHILLNHRPQPRLVVAGCRQLIFIVSQVSVVPGNVAFVVATVFIRHGERETLQPFLSQ